MASGSQPPKKVKTSETGEEIMTSAPDSQPPKKVKTSESGEEIAYEAYDAETRKALEEIESCQQQIDALNEQAGDEILKLEQEYNKLRKPLYEKRSKFTENIPYFWTTALTNHPQLSAIIDKGDGDILEHLVKVEIEEFEDIKSGFKISFHFSENPYFENDIIVKEFYLDAKPDPESKSSAIRWKGKDLTTKKCTKNNGESSRKRALEQNTFFSWFSDNSDPCADNIADIIKDDLWANPLQYYFVPSTLGQAGSDSGLEEEEDDYDDKEDEDNSEKEVKEEEELSESEGTEEDEEME